MSQHPQLLEPGLLVGGHERLERSLRFRVKGCLSVLRQSHEGAERCDIFPLPSGEVLFHIRLVESGKGGEFMFWIQKAVFIEPGATGRCARDIGGSIRGLFDRGFEGAAGRTQHEHWDDGPNSDPFHVGTSWCGRERLPTLSTGSTIA